MSTNSLPTPNAETSAPAPAPSASDDRTSTNDRAFGYSSDVYRRIQWHDQAASAQAYKDLTATLTEDTQVSLRKTTVQLADEAQTLHAQDPKTALPKWVQRHPDVWKENGVCRASTPELLQIMVAGRGAISARDLTPQLMMGVLTCLATPSSPEKK
jgi:hypothetical protein